MKKTLVLLTLLALLVGLVPCAQAQSPTVTIMVYLCASDLESQYGAASSDINEMLYATLSENVNIVLEAGGANAWQNSVMDASVNQRYLISPEGMTLLEDLPQRDMTDPQTLTDFIGFCASEYPADRNILILWDHGGGSLYGFGSDEHFPGNALTLDELSGALAQAQTHFDLIGFDACLMGTVETGIALSGSADYMLASQELEPGLGWYYTDWLSALSSDPGMDTVQLGTMIVDHFVDTCEQEGQEQATLSLVDLAALSGEAENLLSLFSEATNQMILDGQYAEVSKARSGAKAFGYDEFDHIDLIDLAGRVGGDAAQALIERMEQAIVYNRTTRNCGGANGLSVYFPYYEPTVLDSMLTIYDGLSWPDAYTQLIRNFTTVLAGGQIMIDTQESPFSHGGGGLFSASALDDPDATAGFSSSSWFDAVLAASEAQYIEANHLSDDQLLLSEKGDGYVLSLSEAQWALVDNVQQQVYVDDGSGYIDLGSDDLAQYDDDGDLICAFDYEWVALNGQIVPYYAGEYTEKEGGYFCYTGFVPVKLNGRDMQLCLAWDSEHDGGYVMGARPVYGQGNPMWRGLVPLAAGDVVQPICAYYTYDEQFEDNYPLGDALTIDGPVQVSYEKLDDFDVLLTLMLTDVYANSHWTEPLEYTDAA
ncbi:MAG: clostripain-related cysteine peptidase [Clostridia bacterium]